MKDYIRGFLTAFNFDGKTQVAVANYGKYVKIPLLFKAGRSKLFVDYVLDFVEKIGGQKNLDAVLKSIQNDIFDKENGARDDSTKSVVLFIKGSAVPDKNLIKQIKKRGINLWIVSIGEDRKDMKLAELIGDENVIGLNNTSLLPNSFSNLRRNNCH